MNINFLLRLLWSGWFAVGAGVIVVAFIAAWRRRKLTLVQVLVSLLLAPIFCVGAVNVWFFPNLIDGLLAMFILGAVVTALVRAWEKRRTKT